MCHETWTGLQNRHVSLIVATLKEEANVHTDDELLVIVMVHKHSRMYPCWWLLLYNLVAIKL